jgi:solute carrier family 25 protein 39/40
MLTYDHLLNVVLPPLIPSPYFVPLFSGVLARTTVTTIVSPLELIRTNLQATPQSPNQPQTLRSVLSAVRSLIRDNGPRSLWRGLGPTLWRDVPFSGIYWASYERWKHVLQKPGRPVALVAFISGAISGTFSALLTSPFDVLKTRRQALLMSSEHRMMGTMPLLLRIVRTEGYPALFTGLKPRIAKIAPACGIMITCFEVSRLVMIILELVLTKRPQGVGGFLSKKESGL